MLSSISPTISDNFIAVSRVRCRNSELQKILQAKAQLLEMKAELERTQPITTELDLRLERIESELALDSGAIAEYDDTVTRQLITNIKVLDREHLLIRFKDGTEIEQIIQKTKGATEP